MRVQALETARICTRTADAEVELGPDATLLVVGVRQARPQLEIVGCGPRPALDATGGLEPRHRRNEVRAGQPEGRREGLARLVERGLLGDGGPAERAANGDLPECAGWPP